MANPMLYSINPAVPFTPQQNMEIIMNEQYITFINEDNALKRIRKNSFVNAKLCLKNALLPDEDVEEIEISIVAGRETKIHGMLLHITHQLNESNKNAKKVCYCMIQPRSNYHISKLHIKNCLIYIIIHYSNEYILQL